MRDSLTERELHERISQRITAVHTHADCTRAVVVRPQPQFLIDICMIIETAYAAARCMIRCVRNLSCMQHMNKVQRLDHYAIVMFGNI